MIWQKNYRNMARGFQQSSLNRRSPVLVVQGFLSDTYTLDVNVLWWFLEAAASIFIESKEKKQDNYDEDNPKATTTCATSAKTH